MLKDNLFIDIIKRKIPADIVYQDKWVTAFFDISPQAPVHVLIVPNMLIPTVNHVTIENEKILGKLFLVASRVAKQTNIHNSGYRLIINCNRHAGQEINHIHMHLLGGKPLGPLLI